MIDAKNDRTRRRILNGLADAYAVVMGVVIVLFFPVIIGWSIYTKFEQSNKYDTWLSSLSDEQPSAISGPFRVVCIHDEDYRLQDHGFISKQLGIRWEEWRCVDDASQGDLTDRTLLIVPTDRTDVQRRSSPGVRVVYRDGKKIGTGGSATIRETKWTQIFALILLEPLDDGSVVQRGYEEVSVRNLGLANNSTIPLHESRERVRLVLQREIGHWRRNTEEFGTNDDTELHQIDGALLPPSPGVKTRTLREGDGERAHHGQKATVHYMGWLFDPHSDDGRGDEFHNTWRTGEPFVFSLGEGRVIRGLDSGVIGMKVGEIRELTIEADMAFGDRGAGDLIPSGATLVIEIELLGLEDET